jgi:large subunit ribosomal protein L14e
LSSKVTLPELGRVVEIMRGRDRGLFAVVVGHGMDRFAMVADGDKRRAENPKKKNALHLRPTSIVAEDVKDDLAHHGRVTNARLRHTLKQAYMAMGRNPEE